MDTRRSERERGKGHDRIDPLVRHQLEGGKEKNVFKNNIYLTISSRA